MNKLANSHIYKTMLIVLVLIACGLSFAVGHYLNKPGYAVAAPDELITIDEALNILAGSEYSHQYYIDHPELITPITGTVEDNRRWIENYQAVRRLLMSLAVE